MRFAPSTGLITAVAWPAALVSAANVLDNPWNVCIQRATSTGKELAEVLLARQQVNHTKNIQRAHTQCTSFLFKQLHLRVKIIFADSYKVV